jgi:hypothetical protein
MTVHTGRHEALLRTAARQRLARRYEDISAGRYCPAASPGDAKSLQSEVARAGERRARLAAALAALAEGAPELAGDVARVLAHERAAAVCLDGAALAAAAGGGSRRKRPGSSGAGG